jgi:hypothetical protein
MSDFETASWISALAATGGLIFTGWQIRINSKSVDIGTAEKAFAQLNDFQARLDLIPKDDSIKIKEWRSLFLNQLEWFSFLVNHKKIKDKDLLCFFEEAIVYWYENIYLPESEGDVYEELRAWYERIKKRGLRPCKGSKRK